MAPPPHPRYRDNLGLALQQQGGQAAAEGRAYMTQVLAQLEPRLGRFNDWIIDLRVELGLPIHDAKGAEASVLATPPPPRRRDHSGLPHLPLAGLRKQLKRPGTAPAALPSV